MWRIPILTWLLSMFGCSPQIDGRALENSIQPLTAAELRMLDEIREQHAADAQHTPSDVPSGLALLQSMIQDGSFEQTQDMLPLGVIWGDLICQETGTEWVTVEWDGTRMLALNVPETTILLFPTAMLEKRRDRREAVDFRFFLTNTVNDIEQMKANPEYQR